MLKINHGNNSLHYKSKLCHVIIFTSIIEYVYCNTKNKSLTSNEQPSHFLLGLKKKKHIHIYIYMYRLLYERGKG